MKLFKLLYVLYKIKLLSPITLYQLVSSFFKCGINLMTLLVFAEKKYSNRVLLIDDDESLTYKQLLEASNKLALTLNVGLGVQGGQKVAVMCKNHASLIKSIFAVSRVGADLYFINTEISKHKFNELIMQHQFNLLVYDIELSPLVDQSDYLGKKIYSYHSELPAINNNLHIAINKTKKIPKASGGKIVLHTSGTTGTSKEIEHNPSLFNYLNPFVAFINRLKILQYNTAYIATPIYHGYGIAVLLLFIPLGKKIIVSKGFNAEHACRLIKEHRVEVVTVVPTMLQRMLQTNKDDMKTLRCIASGGAKLNSKLVDETIRSLGNVLYNLYGTTEAGLNFIATPEDLRVSSTTVGKAIKGMRIRVLDSKMNEVEEGKVGQFYIRNEWSMRNKKDRWIQTGDLGYRDEQGSYFLLGRTDDLVISGGVNVYPIELEQMLMKHPFVEDAAVIGIEDENFGQRLKAYIIQKDNSITKNELREWLRSRVSRFQLPKEIEFVDQLPYTPLGKLDKTKLYKMNHNRK